MPNWVKNVVRCNNIEGLNWIERLYCGWNEDGEKAPEEKRFSFEEVIPLNGEDARETWGTKWDAQDPEFIKDTDPRLTFDTAWSTPRPVFQAMAQQLKRLVWVEYADEDTGFNCGAVAYTPHGYAIELDKTGDPDFAAQVWGYTDMGDEIRKGQPDADPEAVEEEVRQMKEWWTNWHLENDGANTKHRF